MPMFTWHISVDIEEFLGHRLPFAILISQKSTHVAFRGLDLSEPCNLQTWRWTSSCASWCFELFELRDLRVEHASISFTVFSPSPQNVLFCRLRSEPYTGACWDGDLPGEISKKINRVQQISIEFQQISFVFSTFQQISQYFNRFQ